VALQRSVTVTELLCCKFAGRMWKVK